MDRIALELKIQECGREFFHLIKGDTPSLFNKDWWNGKVMDWAMHNASFKLQLFRFVDVLPCLKTDKTLMDHIGEYFGTDDDEIPSLLRIGAKSSGLRTGFTENLIGSAVRKNIESMAYKFIIGDTMESAANTIAALRQEGFAFTVDILGEAAISENEAVCYQQKYLNLIDYLYKQQHHWADLGNHIENSNLDWGHGPKINVSVKPSTLYSQIDPMDFENSVQTIYQRFLPLVKKAKEIGAFVCIDMEQHRYKDITLEVYRKLKANPDFVNFPYLGIVLQAYLLETEHDLDNLLSWSKKENIPISIRLVKGAYWDYEVVIARQNGWQIPVFIRKEETDACFEKLAEKILENNEICHFACASHNIRSIAAVLEFAKKMKVRDERYEFQVLYGMAGPVRRTLLKIANRVRLYCPYGELIPGMGYLVRRLLENTANESFLRQSFVEGESIEKMLENPKDSIERIQIKKEQIKPKYFINEPQADFSHSNTRESFVAAIAEVQVALNRSYPLIIAGKDIVTLETQTSFNPADPDEIIGTFSCAGKKEIDLAIAAASKSQSSWQSIDADERAGYLFRTAEIMRKRIFELSAWQIFEVGKQWNQAHADVTEAIDFLEYYGREMIRLGKARQLGTVPGELNHYSYVAKGVAAVIAPWNFPLAISCGMTAAALVTGNTVLYKPSSLSSVIGYHLAEIYRQAGIPDGVFNFIPCRGSTIGDYLIEHPSVNVIAFTGSVNVGHRIAEHAGIMKDGQKQIKKVIAEMGGKNSIIIDDDADLDEAIPHVLASAFGYQGQKCSACAKVIVVEAIHDKFVNRLVEAGSSLTIGPAKDPENFMGPVIDSVAKEKILQYIAIAKEEGKIMLSKTFTENGYYVPLTIVSGIKASHRIAQEEIFGPVLAVMKVPDFITAIETANATSYALTGGVFSRSPRNLDLARQLFKVGNLYLNRGITGALVERQPFGGFKMSGIGSKAGGPDYLLQFMDPVTITENSMRRGFAPAFNSDFGI